MQPHLMKENGDPRISQELHALLLHRVPAKPCAWFIDCYQPVELPNNTTIIQDSNIQQIVAIRSPYPRDELIHRCMTLTHRKVHAGFF